ncbi:flagellar biosynthesis protein FlhB [Sporolactobacillus inulinus]|uniref:Flagellar biosynthesis protein FlhB n=1 Tax=Sporolactobacillus inulinus TaxID=2078 RepID=A0A4Y1Z659_9BACL|nr:EscU/YscU/HrcU family type III secretion system export apparatus switch protein [Sporolactobacillus inulinus]GAY74515.1 flagellar biosynthesis protein FlhB [Sporolactobacillus inulinus]
MEHSERKKKAVALSYQRGEDQAPRVVAKGDDQQAERIIMEAKQHDIPIQEDPELVSVLGQLDLEQTIPPELYQIVAELFDFIYTVDEQVSEKKNNKIV